MKLKGLAQGHINQKVQIKVLIYYKFFCKDEFHWTWTIPVQSLAHLQFALLAPYSLYVPSQYPAHSDFQAFVRLVPMLVTLCPAPTFFTWLIADHAFALSVKKCQPILIDMSVVHINLHITYLYTNANTQTHTHSQCEQLSQDSAKETDQQEI